VNNEHYNRGLNQPWETWSRGLRFYPIDQFGDPKSHGPFVRKVQIASANGMAVIFDLKGLARSNLINPLINLMFKSPTIKWLGHIFSSDEKALKNTDRRLAIIKTHTDTKTMCDMLQHPSAMKYVARKLGMNTIDLKKVGIPFEVCTPGLSTICSRLFGITPKKDQQGRALYWANKLTAEQLEYAALDPIITFDVYLRVNDYFDGFYQIRKNLLGGPGKTAKFPMLEDQLISRRCAMNIDIDQVSNAKIGDEIQLGDEILVVEDDCSSYKEETLSENPKLSVTTQNDLFVPDQSAKPKPLPVFPIIPILQQMVPQNQAPNPVLVSPRPNGHRVIWRTVRNGPPIIRVELRRPPPIVRRVLSRFEAVNRGYNQEKNDSNRFRQEFKKPRRSRPNWKARMETFFQQCLRLCATTFDAT